MSENKMLIDAAHPEETRVVVLRAGRVEEFDYESAARKQLRGNIYLAKVTRVEPALQAAFVDYGGNRHGFLAFNEIHPDYYQIPVADRLALLEEEARASKARDDSADDFVDDASVEEVATDEDAESDVEVIGEVDDRDEDEDGLELDDDGADALDASQDDHNTEAVEDEVAQKAAASDDEHSSHQQAEEDDGTTEAASDDLPPLEAGNDASDADSGTAPGNDSPQPGDGEQDGDDDTKVLPQAMVRDPSVSEDPSDEPNPDQVDDPAQSAPVSAKEPDAAPDGVTSEHGNQPAGATAETVIDQTASKDPKGDVNTATDDQSNKQDTGGETAEAVEAPGTIDATDDSAPASAKASDDASADADDESTEADAPRGRRSSGRNTTSRRRRGRSRRSKSRDNDTTADAEADHGQHIGKDDALEEVPARPRRSRRSYKIQEVVKRRQVLLIQVVKEERGNKGAALTTYLSLAGRYTVLMPNTARGGGISRKITNPQDRKRLKAIANELDVPEGMGLIIRTAGAARTKQEIRRDFEYLLRLWESVRELTLESTAPALVYEEGDLIKRSIRDLYNKDVDQVVVAGDAAYRSAKSFMRMLMPSHAKNVTCYSEPEPLYTRYGIERQLNAMFSPYVHLPSGGYLVINQTEALVAVDVNSGRSTREFSIEETALNTNLEAADEVARQLKLRDLAGLIVIDFIDMEERRNNRNVEKRIRDALHADRARIQVGRISPFGLLEMSRQRLRTGVLEGSTSQCEHCQGTGIIRSVESVALGVLRGLEDTVMAGGRHSLIASTTAEVALYILNNKRDFVIDMEKRLGMPISIESSAKMAGANFTIEKGAAAPAPASARADAVSVDWGFEGDKDEEAGTTARTRDRSNEDGEGDGEERSRPRRRRRRRGGRRNGERGSAEQPTDDDNAENSAVETPTDAADDTADNDEDTGHNGVTADGDEQDGSEERSSNRRRRRGRRGGRRNRVRNRDDAPEGAVDADGNPTESSEEDLAAQSDASKDSASQDHGDDSKPASAKARNIEITTPDDDGTPPVEPQPESTGPGHVDAADTQPEIAADNGDRSVQSQPSDEPTNANGASDAATEQQAEKPPARRNRGEQATSEPRIERITVAPTGAGDDGQASNSDGDGDAQPASANPSADSGTDKPVRRGWWQRKLLGE